MMEDTGDPHIQRYRHRRHCRYNLQGLRAMSSAQSDNALGQNYAGSADFVALVLVVDVDGKYLSPT
jgi:hypothetical protein